MGKTHACIVLLCLCTFMAAAQMDKPDLANSEVALAFGNMMMATKAVPGKQFSNTALNVNLKQGIHNVLGFPDLIKSENTFYKLEYQSSVILVFGDYLIENLRGKDIFLFGEGNFSNVRASISVNGKNWIDLGKVDPESRSINLKKISYDLGYYKYFRISNYQNPKTRRINCC